ncbi:MAG: transposase [Gammaproteobacteria bacterium]
MRYQAFILCCFSMGLRLSETLNLKVSDIDSERMKVHIHCAKGRKDSKTKTWKTRCLTGEDFLVLIVQHVLPKGFRRTRDYGFLHGNAKKLLKIIQWVLRVDIPGKAARRKARFCCSSCQGRMIVVGVCPPRPKPE